MQNRPVTLLKKRLWHRCFPVNFAKFLRNQFYRTAPPGDCIWMESSIKWYISQHFTGSPYFTFVNSNSFLNYHLTAYRTSTFFISVCNYFGTNSLEYFSLEKVFLLSYWTVRDHGSFFPLHSLLISTAYWCNHFVKIVRSSQPGKKISFLWLQRMCSFNVRYRQYRTDY